MNHDPFFDTPILQLPDEIVVPDTVEPYIGWKALIIGTDETLYSPTYATSWPVRQPLEATCRYDGAHTYYRWTTTTTPPDPEADEIVYSFDLATTTPIHMTPVGNFSSNPPAIELPDGLYWTLEPHTSETVNEYCRCGIYAVDDPDDCSQYLDTPFTVLVKVAMWGRLIRGATGARGQYAYPQQIIVPEHLRNRAEAIHNTYGVPVVIANLPETDYETPPANRSKYLKPGLAQIIFLLTVAMTILIVSLPLMLGSDGLPAMFTAPLFVWLASKVINDWDKLNG